MHDGILGDAYTGFETFGEDYFGGTLAPPLPEGGASPAPSQQLVAERVPVSEQTNDLTRATVQKMCQYIRESIADPFVQQCAKLAFFTFGRRSPVGVFWFLKHKVRRTLDEGTGLRIGEANAADILISPRVLLRQASPQGDCDDFTMAAAAMLGCLNIECVIVTVACDPQDPDRWSHVFLMAKAPDGEWFPFDCSHGPKPGWMVPRERISRWQAWNLQGSPVNVDPPVRSRLGQFVNVVPRSRRAPGNARGMRGLGQTGCVVYDDGTDNGLCGSTTTTTYSGVCAGSCASGQFMDQSTCTCVGAISTNPTNPSGTTSSTSSGINWTSIISGALTDATKVASIAELPYGASLNANGTVTGVASSPAAILSSLMPFLLIAGGILIFVEVLGSHK